MITIEHPGRDGGAFTAYRWNPELRRVEFWHPDSGEWCKSFHGTTLPHGGVVSFEYTWAEPMEECSCCSDTVEG